MTVTYTPPDYTDLGATTLTGGASGFGFNLGASDITAVVADGSIWPDGSDGPFYVKLSNPGVTTNIEIIKVTARTGNALTSITRGQGTPSTTAASWLPGAKMELVETAEALGDRDDAIVALAALTAPGSVNDTWIGNRTVNEAISVGTTNTDNLTNLLSKIVAQLKNLSGGTHWYSSIANALTSMVLKAGDTMTGALTVSRTLSAAAKDYLQMWASDGINWSFRQNTDFSWVLRDQNNGVDTVKVAPNSGNVSIAGVFYSPSQFFNVKAQPFGAKGDGSTDDAAAIQAALDAANSAGGGCVYFPKGVYLVHTTLTFYSFVNLVGDGPNVSEIRAKSGLNADVLKGLNFASLTGTNDASHGVHEWSIRNMSIDGDYTNQSGTSYGIRVYGWGYVLDNVVIRNCLTDGMYSECTTTADVNPSGERTPWGDDIQARMNRVKFIKNRGHGLNFAGPHDSILVDCLALDNGNADDGHAGFYIQNTTNFTGGIVQLIGCHSAGNNQSWALKAEAAVKTVCCQFEGAQRAQVLLAGSGSSFTASNSSMSDDSIYSSGTISAPVGIEIGSSSPSAAPSVLNIRATIIGCTSGAIKFTNDGGSSVIDLVTTQASGTLISGTRATNTRLSVRPLTTGTGQSELEAHILTVGGTPTLGSLKTGISSQTIIGDDAAGTVTLVTTGSPPGTFTSLCDITFAKAYAVAPIVVLNANAADFAWTSVTTTGFSIWLKGGSLSAASTYFINFIAIGTR